MSFSIFWFVMDSFPVTSIPVRMLPRDLLLPLKRSVTRLYWWACQECLFIRWPLYCSLLMSRRLVCFLFFKTYAALRIHRMVVCWLPINENSWSSLTCFGHSLRYYLYFIIALFVVRLYRKRGWKFNYSLEEGKP